MAGWSLETRLRPHHNDQRRKSIADDRNMAAARTKSPAAGFLRKAARNTAYQRDKLLDSTLLLLHYLDTSRTGSVFELEDPYYVT